MSKRYVSKHDLQIADGEPETKQNKNTRLAAALLAGAASTSLGTRVAPSGLRASPASRASSGIRSARLISLTATLFLVLSFCLLRFVNK